jgi:Caspase domain
MSITTNDLRHAFAVAIEQHPRVYSGVFSLHIRWENDDTDAKRDCRNFNKFLHCFGFPLAEEFEIPTTFTTPGWNLPDWKVQEKYRSVLKTAANAAGGSGRSIVFVHYTGHGARSPSGELMFTSSKSKMVISPESVFFNGLAEPRPCNLPANFPVDVVFIFDCCYSFLAITGGTSVPVASDGRVVEILASVDMDSRLPFMPRQVSFTAKLATTATFLRVQGERSVVLCELVAILRKECWIKKPSNLLRMGTSSVWLKLKLISATIDEFNNYILNILAPRPSWTGSCRLLTVFYVCIADDVSTEVLEALASSTRLLEPSINLAAAYETGSACILLAIEAPYVIFTKLRSIIPNVVLICETTKGNLLKGLAPPTTPKESNDQNTESDWV